MVKAVDGWEFNNVAGRRCSYGTTVRRVAVQGLVCPPRMLVIQIRAPPQPCPVIRGLFPIQDPVDANWNQLSPTPFQHCGKSSVPGSNRSCCVSRDVRLYLIDMRDACARIVHHRSGCPVRFSSRMPSSAMPCSGIFSCSEKQPKKSPGRLERRIH